MLTIENLEERTVVLEEKKWSFGKELNTCKIMRDNMKTRIEIVKITDIRDVFHKGTINFIETMESYKNTPIELKTDEDWEQLPPEMIGKLYNEVCEELNKINKKKELNLNVNKRKFRRERRNL